MFVSKSVIESLIIDLALKGSFERDEAHELLYHLSKPGQNGPACMAEVIIEHPAITDRPSHLPARLAFGLIDDALCRFDLEIRKQRRLKFFRALNLVRLALQQHEFPDIAITLSHTYHNKLVFAAEALQRLADKEELFPAEAPTLMEQLLLAHLEIQAVTELLLEIQIRRLTQPVRSRLKKRVTSALHDGVFNPPSNPNIIMPLDEPIGFRKELREHRNFKFSTAQLNEFFSSLC